MPQVGQYVRTMALQRRITAVLLFGASGGMMMLLLFLVVQQSPLLLPLGLVCAGLAIGAFVRGRYFWRRANRADQGAAGEEAIAALLMPLQQQGWQVEFGIPDRSVGDVDVFLLSPKGNAYTIDVKSHRGNVVSDGDRLYRLRGQTQAHFEKDFLAQAKRQAEAIGRLKRLDFVQPMVAFSNAQVRLDKPLVLGVYVVGKPSLLNRLYAAEGEVPPVRLRNSHRKPPEPK